MINILIRMGKKLNDVQANSSSSTVDLEQLFDLKE